MKKYLLIAVGFLIAASIASIIAKWCTRVDHDLYGDSGAQGFIEADTAGTDSKPNGDGVSKGGSAPLAATPSESPAPADSSAGSPIICTRPVIAYSPFNPSKAIGKFLKGTSLIVNATEEANGMVRVTLRRPKGAPIQALCRAEDLRK